MFQALYLWANILFESCRMLLSNLQHLFCCHRSNTYTHFVALYIVWLMLIFFHVFLYYNLIIIKRYLFLRWRNKQAACRCLHYYMFFCLRNNRSDMVFYQDFLGVVALVSFSNNFTILYYAVRFVHSTLIRWHLCIYFWHPYLEKGVKNY